MAEVWTEPVVPTAAPAAQVRRIGMGEIGTALRRGWADFLAAPTQVFFLCIIYPVVGLLAATLAAGRDALHLLYPMAAGFALVGPIAALGLYEISRQREQGLPVNRATPLAALRSPAIGAICALGVALVGIFMLWLYLADLIHAATLGRLPAGTDRWAALFTTPEGWRLIWMGNAVGFVFAGMVLVLTSLSFPMLLDRGGGVGRAVAVSIRAFAVNPLPMAAWGLIVAVLLVAGMLPFFVGLAVVMPVLGHATWHLYRLVVR